MKGCQDPGSVLMEGEAFDALAFRLEFGLHHLCQFTLFSKGFNNYLILRPLFVVNFNLS